MIGGKEEKTQKKQDSTQRQAPGKCGGSDAAKATAEGKPKYSQSSSKRHFPPEVVQVLLDSRKNVTYICFQIMRGSFDPSEDINMETMA